MPVARRQRTKHGERARCGNGGAELRLMRAGELEGRESRRVGGVDAVAHNGSKGVDGELGEAWTASNRRWGCRRPKLEDDDDAVVAGRPEWLLSVDRRRSSMRSSGTRREGSGVAVAASACGGALRCVRASQERARERRGEAQERGSEAEAPEDGADGQPQPDRASSNEPRPTDPTAAGGNQAETSRPTAPTSRPRPAGSRWPPRARPRRAGTRLATSCLPPNA